MGDAAVKLIIDKKREEAEELGAYEDIFDKYEQQADHRAGNSLWGKVLGGMAGFFLGGIPGMYLLSFVGSEAGKWMVQHDDLDEIEDLLEDQTYGGGKFNAGDFQAKIDDELKYAEDRQDAYAVDTIMQAALTGVSLATAGAGMWGEGGKVVGGTGVGATDTVSLFGDSSVWSTMFTPEGLVGPALKHSLASHMIEQSAEERDPDAAFNDSLMAAMGMYFV